MHTTTCHVPVCRRRGRPLRRTDAYTICTMMSGNQFAAGEIEVAVVGLAARSTTHALAHTVHQTLFLCRPQLALAVTHRNWWLSARMFSASNATAELRHPQTASVTGREPRKTAALLNLSKVLQDGKGLDCRQNIEYITYKSLSFLHNKSTTFQPTTSIHNQPVSHRPITMFLLNKPLYSLWILWLLSGIVQSQDNPFAVPPAPAAQQPLDDNPFAPVGGTGVAPPAEDDNPFKPPTEQVGGASCGSAASLDPSNPAGTCCCDPKKTYQVPTTPQPSGGCCAKGNKWSCSCQDGGSFKHNPLECPVLHRNTRITPSGPTFELFCNVQTHRKNLKGAEPAESFIECVDSCGATPGCMGVDFNKVTKQCYLKSEYMDENTSGAVNNDVDSATMTPLKCPDISKS